LVRAGATIRKYPSFYKSNILHSPTADLKGTLLSSGIYEVKGDSEITGTSPRLWMKVKTAKGDGWVLATEVEMN
jgi:hypothetical protein